LSAGTNQEEGRCGRRRWGHTAVGAAAVRRLTAVGRGFDTGARAHTFGRRVRASIVAATVRRCGVHLGLEKHSCLDLPISPDALTCMCRTGGTYVPQTAGRTGSGSGNPRVGSLRRTREFSSE